MGMKHFTLFLTLFLLYATCISAQEHDSLPKTVPGRILDGDTVPFIEIGSVNVYPPYEFRNQRQQVRYTRLVYNIRKVYPYARLAGEKLDSFRLAMDTLTTEKDRKLFAWKAQKELEDQFGDQIRELTFSQGKILIKLIYRQTGNTSYEIVRELRGKFSAFIWQTLANLFGYDLKTGYYPEGEDRPIEEIVLLIDQGYF